MKKYVGYYRVSSKDQNYGISSQLTIAHKWVQGKGKLITSFQEKVSGRINDRPMLQLAIARCKEEGATLLITKLDRLARSVVFLFQLKESGIDIACCDLPELNTLTLGIFATMAQYEAELISRRTKEGLAVARSRGRIGGAKKGVNTTKAVAASIAVRKIKANARNKSAVSIAVTLRNQDMTYQCIADSMSSAGFTSPLGKTITPQTVRQWVETSTVPI